MKLLLLIFFIAAVFTSCKSSTDSTEDNNLEGQPTELGLDNQANNGMQGSDSVAGQMADTLQR